jgi:hypothetical protein
MVTTGMPSIRYSLGPRMMSAGTSPINPVGIMNNRIIRIHKGYMLKG